MFAPIIFRVCQMADLVASEIHKTFQTSAETLTILDGVTLELDRGQQIAIVGESGSGKSTLLHILGTLDRPDEGTVTLDDVDVTGLPEKQLPAFRNQQVGFIFQQHFLLPQLTAVENVLVPAIAQGAANSNAVDRARSLLDAVGMSHRLDHRPALLSGGECQRVAVARALMNDPAMILADEPTGSLDEDNAAAIGELLRQTQQETNAILVCVTHSPSLAATFETRKRLHQGRLTDE